MDSNTLVPALRRGIVSLLLAGSAATAGAATVWQQDWEDSGSLLGRYGLGADDLLRHDENGELLLALSRDNDVGLVRLRADGSVRWQHASGVGRSYGVMDVAAFADGSAAQLQYWNGAGYLTRLDASGQAAWGLALPAQVLAVAGAAIVGAGCQRNIPYVTAVNAASGQVIWQRALSSVSVSCSSLKIAAAGADVYAGYFQGGGSNSYVITRLDSQGQVAWTKSFSTNGVVRLAPNGNNVYALSADTLSVFRASDGGTLWQSPCSGSRFNFVGADPVCRTSNLAIKRLAAANGNQVWTHGVNNGVMLGVFEGDVYFQGTDNWQRWAGGTGLSQWQAPLNGSSFEVDSLWRSAPGTVAFLEPGLGQDPDTHRFRRWRLSDGAELTAVPLPQLPRGIDDIARLHDGEDLFLRSRAPNSVLPERVRRVAAASGNSIWEASSAESGIYPVLAATNSRLYMAEVSGNSSKVRGLDRTGGATAWTREILWLDGNSGTSGPPDLLTLPNGDAVALHTFYYLSQPQGPYYSEVQYGLRINGNDGVPVWDKDFLFREDIPFPEGIYAPRGLVFGEDVILAPGATDAAAKLPLQRVDAASGTPLWSVNLTHGVERLAKAVDENAFFAFDSGNRSARRISLSKHDAATGATLWSYTQDLLPGREFVITALRPLPGGDVLIAGNVYAGPAVLGTLSGRVLRIRADGSGLRYAWTSGGDPARPIDSVGSFVIDAAGKAWMYRSQHDRRLGLAHLARFELEQGRVLGAQIHQPFYTNPLFPVTHWDGQLVPYQGEQLLDSGSVVRPPLPVTQRIALRDFSVVRRGDLAVEVSVLPAAFAPGTQLPLSARVSYEGDGPVTGAVLILDPLWQGSAGAFTCSGNGVSNCSVESRFGQIIARFDAVPGARLQLAGQVRAQAWPTAADAVPRAVVYGPEELLESDIGNNVRSISATGPIFVDGFQ